MIECGAYSGYSAVRSFRSFRLNPRWKNSYKRESKRIVKIRWRIFQLTLSCFLLTYAFTGRSRATDGRR